MITSLFTHPSVNNEDGIPTTESDQKRGWNDTEIDGNVEGGRTSGRSHSAGNGNRSGRGSGNNSGNNSGRGLEDSGIYYDDSQVGGSDGVHDSEGNNHEFNDDIHYRRASAPTVIHYSDFDDEDVVVVGNHNNNTEGLGPHGEVGNPLWTNAP